MLPCCSVTPAQIKPKSFDSRRNFFFFTRGGCVSCLHECLGARLFPQSYQYPNSKHSFTTSLLQPFFFFSFFFFLPRCGRVSCSHAHSEHRFPARRKRVLGVWVWAQACMETRNVSTPGRKKERKKKKKKRSSSVSIETILVLFVLAI